MNDYELYVFFAITRRHNTVKHICIAIWMKISKAYLFYYSLVTYMGMEISWNFFEIALKTFIAFLCSYIIMLTHTYLEIPGVT